jgi:heme-degrading monooxygenase HmoA
MVQGGTVLRATLHMRVKEGRERDFEDAWRTIAEEVRRAPGSIRQALLRDPEDQRNFVVTSDWENRDAFTRFERSPEQDNLTAPLRDFRESGQMTVHELLVHVEGD